MQYESKTLIEGFVVGDISTYLLCIANNQIGLFEEKW